MFYTGFADEAAVSLDGQIEATKKLGWTHIESRSIDNVNLHDLPEDKFEECCGKLADAGITVNCFGSTIANWSREPLDDQTYEEVKVQMKRALARMKKMNCRLIRGMSFHWVLTRPAFDPELENWIFPRVRELVQMCADAGVMYGHENCMNYGGMSYKHTLKLLEKVNNPALTLIFDTGNPAMAFDRSRGDELTGYQNSFEFYRNVKEFISYVHIKDLVMVKNDEGNMVPKFVWANEGDGHVEEIVADLLKSGYDGGFSMEPHMVRVFHDPNPGDNSVNDNYVEYGRRFMALVDKIKAGLDK